MTVTTCESDPSASEAVISRVSETESSAELLPWTVSVDSGPEWLAVAVGVRVRVGGISDAVGVFGRGAGVGAGVGGRNGSGTVRDVVDDGVASRLLDGLGGVFEKDPVAVASSDAESLCGCERDGVGGGVMVPLGVSGKDSVDVAWCDSVGVGGGVMVTVRVAENVAVRVGSAVGVGGGEMVELAVAVPVGGGVTVADTVGVGGGETVHVWDMEGVEETVAVGGGDTVPETDNVADHEELGVGGSDAEDVPLRVGRRVLDGVGGTDGVMVAVGTRVAVGVGVGGRLRVAESVHETTVCDDVIRLDADREEVTDGVGKELVRVAEAEAVRPVTDDVKDKVDVDVAPNVCVGRGVRDVDRDTDALDVIERVRAEHDEDRLPRVVVTVRVRVPLFVAGAEGVAVAECVRRERESVGEAEPERTDCDRVCVAAVRDAVRVNEAVTVIGSVELSVRPLSVDDSDAVVVRGEGEAVRLVSDGERVASVLDAVADCDRLAVASGVLVRDQLDVRVVVAVVVRRERVREVPEALIDADITTVSERVGEPMTDGVGDADCTRVLDADTEKVVVLLGNAALHGCSIRFITTARAMKTVAFQRNGRSSVRSI